MKIILFYRIWIVIRRISELLKLSDFKYRLIRLTALLIIYTHWFSCLYWAIVSKNHLFQANSEFFNYELMLNETKHISIKYLYITHFIIDQIYGGTLIKIEPNALLDKTFNSFVIIVSYLFLFYLTGNHFDSDEFSAVFDIYRVGPRYLQSSHRGSLYSTRGVQPLTGSPRP